MRPRDVTAARKALGLTQAGLAEALRMGPNGERTVRRWEQGETPVSGPASVAIELLSAQSEAQSAPKPMRTKGKTDA